MDIGDRQAEGLQQPARLVRGIRLFHRTDGKVVKLGETFCQPPATG